MAHKSNRRSVVVVHSSDIHVDTDWTARLHGGDGTRGLRMVLETARSVRADLVVLAGDVFDHNLPENVLARTAELLGACGRPVIVLPGNHDPAVSDSGWHRGPFARHADVHVLGVTRRAPLVLPQLELEVTGKPHSDYDDMVPLRTGRTRRARWRIAMAHGHYTPVRDRTVAYHPSWLIHDRHIASADADYVALGHWNRPARVGPDGTRAYYCGSPDLAGTVNVVTLKTGGAVTVRREPIRGQERSFLTPP
jgi:DNA repair exonuclease SbcCD nuclease subunit